MTWFKFKCKSVTVTTATVMVLSLGVIVEPPRPVVTGDTRADNHP